MPQTSTPSTSARRRVGRGLLVLLAGAAISLAAVACSDDDATGTTDPTTSTTPVVTETPGEGGNGTSPGGTGTAAGGDTPVTDGTPAPGGASPPPDTPVSSTPGGGSSPPSTRTVAPVDPGYPTVEELAPIESAEILVMESFPPQYAVQIVSGLPSGCAVFLRSEVVERSGTTIRIEVVNQMPAPDSNVACTMIYGIHESSVMLGSEFESGVTYAVEVNDKVTGFTAQ